MKKNEFEKWGVSRLEALFAFSHQWALHCLEKNKNFGCNIPIQMEVIRLRARQNKPVGNYEQTRVQKPDEFILQTILAFFWSIIIGMREGNWKFSNQKLLKK